MKKKGYFSISAVSHMFNIHQQTIRMYEKLGFINPKRSEGNTRMFSENDIAALEKIIYYTNTLGANLAAVEIILKMQKKIEKMQEQINDILITSTNELKQEVKILEEEISESEKKIESVRKIKNQGIKKCITTKKKTIV
jgi:MerR family transcriptional regulator/heat shock protein HspR